MIPVSGKFIIKREVKLFIYVTLLKLQLSNLDGGGSSKGPDATTEALRQMLAQHMVNLYYIVKCSMNSD